MSQTSQTYTLGKRLKEIREANGLSQRELAKRAGVTNSSISMIEQGQVSPSVQSLEKVLAGIPMSLSHFFSSMNGGSGDVFFDQHNMVKHDKLYGFMQMIGEDITNRNVTLKHFYFDPQTDTGETPMMSHFDQAGWVCQGDIQMTIGAKIKELSPGEGFYLAAYTPCRVRNLSELNSAQIVVATEVLAAP
ncbi:helix-turn-helix domain-containing protein [Gilvimarinus agarilyticus]|uniref:helix-turn-helix domain-containing protein n=1 Tax=Gilvimarinus agarilyticus TaxID=679259 RepID=UPI0005A2F448|nr:helix-turn-helix domain-containing protein [Gilvimarinus agarilyticus]